MRRVMIGLFLVALTVPLSAWSYVAFEQVTVTATAIGFTAATINQGNGHPGAAIAVCRLETAQIRYRLDGTAPTSSVGTLLEIGDYLTLSGSDLLVNFSAIRTGSSSGVLDCNYFTP